jgi:hypothetical protein
VPRPLTVALAQTGPLLTETIGDGVSAACTILDGAADAGADIWVAAVNRVGTEEPRARIGRSVLVDPRGGIVREAGMQESELLVETIDLDAVSKQRKKFPWWRDSRPDLCHDITQPD